MDDTFHIVWLDPDHRLFSERATLVIVVQWVVQPENASAVPLTNLMLRVGIEPTRDCSQQILSLLLYVGPIPPRSQDALGCATTTQGNLRSIEQAVEQTFSQLWGSEIPEGSPSPRAPL